MTETIDWAAVDAVKAITVCEVLDQHLPGWVTDYTPDAYERCCAVVREYCEKNNAHYYARGDEDFSKYEAQREAYEAGKTLVVLDNLS